jgi:hypothetical protein
VVELAHARRSPYIDVGDIQLHELMTKPMLCQNNIALFLVLSRPNTTIWWSEEILYQWCLQDAYSYIYCTNWHMILSTSTLILIVTPTSFRYADQLLQDKAIWKGLKMWFHAIFIFLHFLGAFMWTEAREKTSTASQSTSTQGKQLNVLVSQFFLRPLSMHCFISLFQTLLSYT